MAKKPPPPPPPKPKKAPPPPPPKPKKAPPPPPKPKKVAPPPKAKPKAKKAPPPPKPKKVAPPPKAKPKKKRGKRSKKKAAPKKKGRRIRIKLGLKQRYLSSEEDTYEDQVGWTATQEVLEPLDGPQEEKKPEVIEHQCSMCGSVMQIPQPKRDRYKVICAYSECGHEDMIGI